MNLRIRPAFAAASMLTALLVLSQPALAQQGTTSGPAAGTAVIPSTTAQKQNSGGTDTAGHPATTGVQQGAVGVGAPGVAAKAGSESGTSSAPGSGKRP